MLTIVGCGFLGSLAAEEIAKRQFALDDDGAITLIDYDKVEERNAANQLFTPQDTEVSKVDAVGSRISQYGFLVDERYLKIERSNIDTELKGTTLLIDAVDHLPSRQELWMWGKQHKVPVIHIGVSQGGMGRVDWSYQHFDSWPLSPIATLGQPLIGTEKIEKLKPCELIAFRGLGLNMAIATAKAVGLWRGYDPEKAAMEMARTLTTWEATNTGHTLTQVLEDFQ